MRIALLAMANTRAFNAVIALPATVHCDINNLVIKEMGCSDLKLREKSNLGPDIIESRYTFPGYFNTLKPGENGRHFADDILKCNFLNENDMILIQISLKMFFRSAIDNNSALV